MIYFDYAATCPLDDEAAIAYVKTATEYYGNSKSLHDVGSAANELLENCRKELAKLLHVENNGIYFTSGGSESNYLAIMSLLSAKQEEGKHIITSLAEHSSVKGTFEKLESSGYEVTYLPFNQDGLIDLDNLRSHVKSDTVLISIQTVNPEIGSIQPIKEIGEICREEEILFHSDFVQGFGKVNLESTLGYLDSFSLSGHKIFGPKGIGAVYISPDIPWQPYYKNASHENGLRPGTLNVPAIAAMTVAAQKCYTRLNQDAEHYRRLRKTFIKELQPISSKIILYDLPEHLQLPSTLGMRIKGLEGQWVMLECNRVGYALSTGSACQSGMDTPSKTMKAMGVADKDAKEFIRISFGRDTSQEDVKGLAHALKNMVTM